MCCCGVCSSSAGHRFSPGMQTGLCSRCSGYLQAFWGGTSSQGLLRNRLLPRTITTTVGYQTSLEVVRRMQCSLLRPVIVSHLIYVRKDSISQYPCLFLSGMFGGGTLLKVVLKTCNTTHTSTSDHDDQGILWYLSVNVLPDAKLYWWCVLSRTSFAKA